MQMNESEVMEEFRSLRDELSKWACLIDEQLNAFAQTIESSLVENIQIPAKYRIKDDNSFRSKAFYRDKKLAVVGGGNSAVQEALFLTRFASHIDLLVRSKLRASEVLQRELDKAVKDGKITVHLETVPTEIIAGDGKSVDKIAGTKSGQDFEIEVDGIFVFIGLLPNTGFLKDSSIELDEIGMIKTTTRLETNMPGVFASGDVRSGATAQIASAVGEGATAALSIREYLTDQKIS